VGAHGAGAQTTGAQHAGAQTTGAQHVTWISQQVVTQQERGPHRLTIRSMHRHAQTVSLATNNIATHVAVIHPSLRVMSSVLPLPEN
jgi:hypothetical protein